MWRSKFFILKQDTDPIEMACPNNHFDLIFIQDGSALIEFELVSSNNRLAMFEYQEFLTTEYEIELDPQKSVLAIIPGGLLYRIKPNADYVRLWNLRTSCSLDVKNAYRQDHVSRCLLCCQLDFQQIMADLPHPFYIWTPFEIAKANKGSGVQVLFYRNSFVKQSQKFVNYNSTRNFHFFYVLKGCVLITLGNKAVQLCQKRNDTFFWIPRGLCFSIDQIHLDEKDQKEIQMVHVIVFNK